MLQGIVDFPIFQPIGFREICKIKWFKYEAKELLGGTDCLHPADAGARQVG